MSLVAALLDRGDAIVVMSGRDESCRKQTEAWLDDHVPGWTSLHMRPRGDQRKDSVVKAELFDEYVRDYWQVLGVVDDRDQVVSTWRAAGLTCAQVAPGGLLSPRWRAKTMYGSL